MAKEWYAICIDCGSEFGYSDDSYQLSRRRGLSRPERCPACRRLYWVNKEKANRLRSRRGNSSQRNSSEADRPPVSLGISDKPPHSHYLVERSPDIDFNLFGIKDKHVHECFDVMQKHPVTVIVGPAGSGKSTFLPYRLMVPPATMPPNLWTRNGQIAITQPRIHATRNIPAFVAHSLHGSSLGAGFDIGFMHKGSQASDSHNKMVYMTDGVLVNLVVRNELGRFSVILIDEAHERSLNIDLLLGLLKQQLPHYPHLRVIIASATIDIDLFVSYFGGVEQVGFYEFPSKGGHSVELRFRESTPIPNDHFGRLAPNEVAKKAFELLVAMETDGNPELIGIRANDKDLVIKGDILAFLHGKTAIEVTADLIREMVRNEPVLKDKVEVVPLYTSLPQRQQDLALNPKKSNKWRVVISTNVAETSLAIPGIAHVIDSGLIVEAEWDSRSQTYGTAMRFHSQAGCKQRWARAGRYQRGIVHCLYTEEQFGNFHAHTTPQFLRAPLENMLLTTTAAGVDDVKAFDWIHRPPYAELERSLKHLRQIGALDEEGDLTEHGFRLQEFPSEVTEANLMILADRFGCAIEMATILPMMESGGLTRFLLWDRTWDAAKKRAVNRIHRGLMKPCLDDVEFCLKLWKAWEGSSYGRDSNEQRRLWAKHFHIDHEFFLRQIVPAREILLTSLSARSKNVQDRPIDLDLLTRIRIVLTCGLPDQVFRLTSTSQFSQEIDDTPIYRPYTFDSEDPHISIGSNEALSVEIGSGSIFFRRKAPELIICGNRRRMLRRVSPPLEPDTAITVTFICLTKPEWLKLVGLPYVSVARYIAAATRDDTGAITPEVNPVG